MQDFIDVYLKEMESNHALNYHDLVGLCIDFFEAGGETVGSTLSWLLMYFALHQEQQEKCFREIKEEIGKLVIVLTCCYFYLLLCYTSREGDREPTLDDKGKLLYCEATIMEIQRMSCVAAAGLEHKAMEDLCLGGYRIPKSS